MIVFISILLISLGAVSSLSVTLIKKLMGKKPKTTFDGEGN